MPPAEAPGPRTLLTPSLGGMRLLLLAVVLALAGCGGVSELERCIDHSVEEGLDRSQVETACRASLDRD